MISEKNHISILVEAARLYYEHDFSQQQIAQKLGVSRPSVSRILHKARKETQFSKAVKMVKDAIPKELLLTGGHNPLTLVHRALSMGIHELDDSRCLAHAIHVRNVLAALAQQIESLLREDSVLNKSVAELLRMINPQHAN